MSILQDTTLLEYVLRVSRKIAEAEDLNSLLAYVISETLHLTGAERGFILLVKPDGTIDVEIKQAKEGYTTNKGKDEISQTIVQEVLQTQQSLLLRNAMTDPRFMQAHSVLLLRLRSIMCVPLMTHNTFIGVLYVENRSLDGRFQDEDLIPLALFANQAAVAIVNAQIINELRQTQEMMGTYATDLERSNRELQELTYISSHHLQEPLRKIQMLSDRLQSKQATQLDAFSKDYLIRIQDSASRMQTLIEDVLDFSQITAEPPAFKLVDLTDVVQKVIASLEESTQKVGGHIHLHTLPSVEADVVQMVHLFRHLLNNALKFRHPSRPLVVHIAQADTVDAKVEGCCQITVTDNGIGFAEKYQDRIFNLFEQLHGRDAYEGTGAGLAICRKIIESHQGKIKAYSIPGQGAVFRLVLPYQQKPIGRPSK